MMSNLSGVCFKLVQNLHGSKGISALGGRVILVVSLLYYYLWIMIMFRSHMVKRILIVLEILLASHTIFGYYFMCFSFRSNSGYNLICLETTTDSNPDGCAFPFEGPLLDVLILIYL